MKTNNLTLLIAALFFTAGSLFAQSGRPMMDAKKRMAEHLQLTEEQKSQIEALQERHQDQMVDIKSSLKIKEAQLDAAMIDEDAKSATALVEDINELRGSVFTNRIQHQLAIKALLDEDQKRKFDQRLLAKEHPSRGRGLHEGPGRQQQRPSGGHHGLRGGN